MLTLRIENALCKLSGLDPTSGDKETVNCQEESCSSLSTINFGSSSGGKSIVRPIKLPFVEMIPPYTTWIFLDRYYGKLI
jgi:histone-lysine N-methyltransferase EZH2